MRTALRIGSGILLLFIGVLSGLVVCSFKLVRIEPKMDFGNLLQVFATLFLAFLVSNWWREQHFRSDTAKQLLCDYLTQLRATVCKIRSDFQLLMASDTDDKLYPQILSGFREASNTLLELRVTVEAVFRNDPCDELREDLLSLKSAVTSVAPSKLRSQAASGDIETAFSKFQMCLARTQVAVLQLWSW
jgi:hypothetical protein